ncbi:MAG TPA: contact-dependent growth inhibition system immunity protein [Nonomuraea sp.]|nr:contact-dependent growth inhibition system immunity protein [Nonomuraea sp.]
MNTHRQKEKGKSGSPGAKVKPEDFPALAQFLGGYLHQDFLLDHASAPAAARSFRADASPEEARAVDAELDRLLALTERWTVTQIRRFLKSLGAAWLPSTRAELEALRAARD